MSKIITFILLTLFAFPSLALEENDLKTKIAGDHVLGKDSAKVTLIEYASLSCPHCAEFHENMLPVIQKEYIDSGKVRVIFRDFPLNAPALMGSQLAQCAGKGGSDKYYAALKQLFAGQKDWAFDKDFKGKLMGIAQNIGIDAAAFEACLADKDLETKILNSRKDGSEKLKVESTPSFFVNGEKAERMHSVEDVRKTLDTLLSGKSLEKAAKDAAKKAMVIRSDDLVIGQDKAKVSIIEYINIACPHCGQFHKTLLSTLQKDYIDTGKVKLAFRELPMNQTAFHAYMLAHCKGKGEFFNMVSLLIDDTQQWAGSAAFMRPLRSVAEKAGITKEAFYACMENQEIESRIMNTSKEAFEVLGIRHSPELYINGEKAEGMDTPDAIRQAIDATLKGKK